MTNQIDKAPTGATHRYEHANNVDWYCQAEQGLYRWQQGSWCASVHKTIEDLANSCPLGRLEAIPAEPAQPAEDILTWLARNVHKWPSVTPTVFEAGHVLFEYGAHFYYQSVTIFVGGYGSASIITRDQWLARRAELQGKPSWDAVPNHANWMAQDSAGTWLWHSAEPESRNGMWIGGTTRGYAAKGELLGDWRDTLERRPADSITIDWSTAPAEATHHISGNNLEFSWHKNGYRIKYWNGFVWIKRSGFHTIYEARAKGFTVVARPADLSYVASSAASVAAATERLTEATQTVLAAVPGLMDEKYSFEPEFNPVTVTNETVQLEQPVAVAGTGNGSATESAFLIGRVIDLLRTSVDHFSANELADLHQLCDAELTKRDAAVCGGEHAAKFVLVLSDGTFGLVADNCLTWTTALARATLMAEKGWEKFKRFGKLAEVRHGKLVMRAGGEV